METLLFITSTNCVCSAVFKQNRFRISLVSCKNWKTNEYSTYLRIQKYIKVNLIHTLGNFIKYRRRCHWSLLTPFVKSEVRHFGSSGIRSPG